MAQEFRELEAAEQRYDAATLTKVTALAQELQNRHESTLTARQMEEIGAEVGLSPVFMRDALTRITHVPQVQRYPSRVLRSLAGSWWAAGWTLPFILIGLFMALFGGQEELMMLPFFGGWALYIGLGCFLSGLTREDEEPAAVPPARASDRALSSANGGEARVSRLEMLETLFALQRRLEGQRVRRAFLSLDVVGSTEMKQGEPELAVEYSFNRFHAWVEQVVRRHGGDCQSAAGDGVMALFQRDEDAVRAARELQEGMAAFNRDGHRLRTPFRVRCGLSAGEVALEPGTSLGRLSSAVIDRAAALQRAAQPGDIVVDGELARAALLELGSVSRLSGRPDGDVAFSWLQSHPR